MHCFTTGGVVTMQRLGTLLRGMGTACLLVAIVLCQTVLAHDEARTASDRRLICLLYTSDAADEL